jgi:hypothetical protein
VELINYLIIKEKTDNTWSCRANYGVVSCMPAILLSAIGEQLAELASPTNRNLARSQVLVESSSTDDWDLVRQKTLKRQLICPHDPWTDSVRSNPPPAAPYVVVVPRGPRGELSAVHRSRGDAGEERRDPTHVVDRPA